MFFQNRNAHTVPLFKHSKILKFGDKVALENCILVSKSLDKSSPKILCDCFTLSYESHTHNTGWANNRCINVTSDRTKFYGRYSASLNITFFKPKQIVR